MTDILVAFFSALGEVAKGLGFGGTIMAIAALVLLSLAARFIERTDRVLDRLQRRWRKLPRWGRQSLVFLALVFLGPSIWSTFPKSIGAVAVLMGVGAGWWAGGLHYAQRYQLEDTTTHRAWMHHLDVSRSARRHTTALADGSGKKGGRARKPTKVANGQVVIVEPPHGESDVDTADRYESGSMNSALAHQFGWDAIRDVTAEPVGDGTVRVHALQDQAKDDFFDTSHNWPGMESS